jgi:hypothetical protein
MCAVKGGGGGGRCHLRMYVAPNPIRAKITPFPQRFIKPSFIIFSILLPKPCKRFSLFVSFFASSACRAHHLTRLKRFFKKVPLHPPFPTDPRKEQIIPPSGFTFYLYCIFLVHPCPKTSFFVKSHPWKCAIRCSMRLASTTSMITGSFRGKTWTPFIVWRRCKS